MTPRYEPEVEPIDIKPPANVIGNTLKKLRKDNGLSQEALSAKLYANKVYISRASVSRIEEKRRKVTDRELFAFSQVLCVSIEELLDK